MIDQADAGEYEWQTYTIEYTPLFKSLQEF